MPITIDGKTYFRTAEACHSAGVSKNTYLRWVRTGILTDVGQRDRRGWRLFTRDDMKTLKAEVNKMIAISKD